MPEPVQKSTESPSPPSSPSPPPSPQPSPPLSHVFRESFLSLFERPEHEDALRLLGELFYSLIWEGRGLVEADDSRRTMTERGARGALGDLWQALAEIEDNGRLVEEASLNREETRVMLAVADAGSALEPIGDRLQAAYDAFLAADQPEDGP